MWYIFIAVRCVIWWCTVNSTRTKASQLAVYSTPNQMFVSAGASQCLWKSASCWPYSSFTTKGSFKEILWITSEDIKPQMLNDLCKYHQNNTVLYWLYYAEQVSGSCHIWRRNKFYGLRLHFNGLYNTENPDFVLRYYIISINNYFHILKSC